MTEKEQHFPDSEVEDAPESRGSSVSENSRRHFITGTAAGGIVAMTIVGRPAWARNCSYSGRLSGNLSAQDDEPCGGEGLSPGYWKNHLSEWHELWPPNMLFVNAFEVDAFPGKTLREVIWGDTGLTSPEDGSENLVNLVTALGFQAVAALQNAATPVSYLLTVAEVVASFKNAYLSGDPGQIELTKDDFDTLNNLSPS